MSKPDISQKADLIKIRAVIKGKETRFRNFFENKTNEDNLSQ